MTNLVITGLTKEFGGKSSVTAVDNIDLDIDASEFLVLLGPSGCGKTTTLRCIAGLEAPNQGAISFGGRTVFDAVARVDVPPNKRNIGMVFQSYALWPHMTVRKNIAYPLRTRKVSREVAQQWIEEAADLVDCGSLLDRLPAQLSGGQQQRVALARGLVARPDLLLFDEPLSNLDARLRDQVRTEIHELHERLRFTAVYVTHDQTEALALGDRLAIMRDGMIEQLGAPEQIFEAPATEYVAGFIGMVNRLRLERSDSIWTHDGVPLAGEVPVSERSLRAIVARGRPEDLLLSPADGPTPPASLAFPATVVDSEFGGRVVNVVLAIGGTRLQSRMPAGERGSWTRSLERGQLVQGTFPLTKLLYFDDQGLRLASSPPGSDRPIPTIASR